MCSKYLFPLFNLFLTIYHNLYPISLYPSILANTCSISRKILQKIQKSHFRPKSGILKTQTRKSKQKKAHQKRSYEIIDHEANKNHIFVVSPIKGDMSKIVVKRAQIFSQKDTKNPSFGWLTTVESKKSPKILQHKHSTSVVKFPSKSNNMKEIDIISKNLSGIKQPLQEDNPNQAMLQARTLLLNNAPHRKSLLKNRSAYNKMVSERVSSEKGKRRTKSKKYLKPKKTLKKDKYILRGGTRRHSQLDDAVQMNLEVKQMAVNEKEVKKTYFYRSISQKDNLTINETILQNSQTCGSLKTPKGLNTNKHGQKNNTKNKLNSDLEDTLYNYRVKFLNPQRKRDSQQITQTTHLIEKRDISQNDTKLEEQVITSQTNQDSDEDFLTKIHKEFNIREKDSNKQTPKRKIKSAYNKYKKSFPRPIQTSSMFSKPRKSRETFMKRGMSMEMPFGSLVTQKNSFKPSLIKKPHPDLTVTSKSILKINSNKSKDFSKTAESKFQANNSKRQKRLQRPYSGKPRRASVTKSEFMQKHLQKVFQAISREVIPSGYSVKKSISSNNAQANSQSQKDILRSSEIDSTKFNKQDPNTNTYKSSSMTSVKDYKYSPPCVVSPEKLYGESPKKCIQIRMNF
ncbi:unnamed protein product [Moneuplotes crassus]|uniref:Uncharacterized protein n=1 Tax=Euplotes crassus TaxID=5936 RepID=A0AAD2D8N5_EUPCR|nr:unnamed protein product [Moneuplotes crassus]